MRALTTTYGCDEALLLPVNTVVVGDRVGHRVGDRGLPDAIQIVHRRQIELVELTLGLGNQGMVRI